MMKQLIVLDLSDNSVHFYTITQNYEPTWVEDLLGRLGHNSSNCSWMLAEGVKVEVHNKVINEEA